MTKRVPSLPTLVATLILAGCGGGDDSPGGASCKAGTTCANVAGTWLVTSNVNGTACGDGTYTQVDYITIAQNGCAISATVDGITFTGAVDGSAVCWGGSYPDGGGTTTFTSVAIAVSGNSLSGSIGWSWSSGNQTCSGTSAVSGTRQ